MSAVAGNGGPPTVVDLRSDTITQPSPGMRAAMAAAEVGDDVLGDDPTVNRLQKRMAELLGTETALFVPSGSMANLIAVMVHCRHGDEVLVGHGAHIAFHEVGSAAALAGVELVAIGRDGTFTGDDIVAAARKGGRLEPPTRLVAVENTHNRAGGRVWDRTTLAGVVRTARERDLTLHLDGARVLNAAVASGCAVADLCTGFDTVSFAFSKGLGAPVGSVLAGRWPDIDRATRLRKMLGGAMRQAGVLAAAALWALDNNQPRLALDHANAKLLATELAGTPGVHVEPANVQSNIVMLDLADDMPAAVEVAARLDAAGVRLLPFGPARLRLVTHLDVDESACREAAVRMRAVLAQLARRN